MKPKITGSSPNSQALVDLVVQQSDELSKIAGVPDATRYPACTNASEYAADLLLTAIKDEVGVELSPAAIEKIGDRVLILADIAIYPRHADFYREAHTLGLQKNDFADFTEEDVPLAPRRWAPEKVH